MEVCRATWSPAHSDASIYSLALHAASATDPLVIRGRNLYLEKQIFFSIYLDFQLNLHHLLRSETHAGAENVELRRSTVCFHAVKLHPTNGCGLAYQSEAHRQRRGDGEQKIDVVKHSRRVAARTCMP